MDTLSQVSQSDSDFVLDLLKPFKSNDENGARDIRNNDMNIEHHLLKNLNVSETTTEHDSIPMTMQGEDTTKVDLPYQNRRLVEINIPAHNEQPMNSINYSKRSEDEGPIIGYARERLLPLAKACEPLNSIIYDLPRYVQEALEKTSEEPSDGLTIDESAAIRLYTIEWEGSHRSLYSELNHTLKKGKREDLRPYYKYLKLFVTALAKLPCVPPLTVWRGVAKNLSADFPPDTIVTWWGFSSCTIALTVLENNMYLGNSGARTLFSVEALNGRTIRDHSNFSTEEEILLLPGTRMIVQSQLSPASDLYVIHLKQIVPDEVLLELPFEGNVNTVNDFDSFNYCNT